MAKITIRFSSGDETTWTLHDAMDLKQLARSFRQATGGVMSFGVAPEAEDASAADYGYVGVLIDRVASWHIDGMYDNSVNAALFAELQTFENE